MHLLPSLVEVTDLGAVLLREHEDLGAARKVMVAQLDVLVDPQAWAALTPTPVDDTLAPLAEVASDYVIEILVDRALDNLATPEKRRDWWAKRREKLDGFVERREVKQAARKAKRDARKAARG